MTSSVRLLSLNVLPNLENLTLFAFPMRHQGGFPIRMVKLGRGLVTVLAWGQPIKDTVNIQEVSCPRDCQARLCLTVGKSTPRQWPAQWSGSRWIVEGIWGKEEEESMPHGPHGVTEVPLGPGAVRDVPFALVWFSSGMQSWSPWGSKALQGVSKLLKPVFRVAASGVDVGGTCLYPLLCPLLLLLATI